MSLSLVRQLLDDPAIAVLIPRWFQPPRGSVKRTVDALCARRVAIIDEHGDIIGLPTNKQLARQLGVSEATVRKHIEVNAALKVHGLEELNARSRVYLCERWHRALYPRQTPSTGASRVA